MTRSRAATATFLLALLAITPGCGSHHDQITAPGASSSLAPANEAGRAGTLALSVIPGRNDYPLVPGNWWRDRHDITVTLVPVSGPPQTETDHSIVERELLCSVDHDGHTYTVERSQEPARDYTYRTWLLMRQDRDGLYEYRTVFTLDPGCGDAPAGARQSAMSAGDRLWEHLSARITSPSEARAWRAAWQAQRAKLASVDRTLRGAGGMGGGAPPDPDEIQRLKYPLFTGSRWLAASDPDLVEQVQGQDVIDLPAGRFTAWRIRYLSDLYGPHDRVIVWYGRAGFLKLVADLEGDATDESGNVIGTLHSRMLWQLEDLELQKPAGPPDFHALR